MSTLNLGKLYHGGSVVNFDASAIYDKATKQFLSDYITANNTRVGNLENALANKAPVRKANDIAARDALTNVVDGQLCWVVDATADNTVASGAALYLATVSGTPATVSWTKLAEAESMDLVLNWSDIQGKPSSSVSAIDQAVTDSHTHANSSVLGGLSEDSTSHNLVYNGVELGGFTGVAVASTLADATNYTEKLQIVVEAYDPDAAAGA